ncbi:uncharacterized protein MYCFIDRAFT_200777 [Pseudocercospora fijiensis CIRAD86]|uniref:Uncharacterized protein n=1 Tax=Pseudocercospora fijiensis (strain CIRAD86) TaxID=383855 RepID=M3AIR5_PSEFD|nr:uncharacterized protein MYCFIDRAFT_200777 [Pseudocercospora fijiensis CIRAD86]EME77088.1 hypothetical protein MYCFIDRAFT_200777 [Pseudocercospora fijiensis CIRAD86]
MAARDQLRTIFGFNNMIFGGGSCPTSSPIPAVFASLSVASHTKQPRTPMEEEEEEEEEDEGDSSSQECSPSPIFFRQLADPFSSEATTVRKAEHTSNTNRYGVSILNWSQPPSSAYSATSPISSHPSPEASILNSSIKLQEALGFITSPLHRRKRVHVEKEDGEIFGNRARGRSLEDSPCKDKLRKVRGGGVGKGLKKMDGRKVGGRKV